MTEAIPTEVIKALAWMGIKPPLEGRRKTFCPQCSAARKKASRPCLSVYTRKGEAYVMCHHCGWERTVA